MKKRSLLFGFVAAMIAAFIFSGCESPTDGSAGASGADGVVPLSDLTVSAADLEAVFKVTDRVILLPGVTSVTGRIPAGKTLFVSGGATKVADGSTLVVYGALEIFEGAALNASGVSNAGYIWGTGSVTGDGEIGLPYLDGEVQGDDIPIIYTSANVSVAGKYAASYSTGGDPTAITADNAATILASDGVTVLTLSGIAGVEDAPRSRQTRHSRCSVPATRLQPIST
jgi:hypothetical protein